MKIKNPIRMNDWKFVEFLKVVLTVQIALLAIIILDSFGVKIPILRELTALIYLIFVPGILILRILKLHNLDSIETLLYTVGLSVASLLIIGFLMDMIYPLWGVKPLSEQSLLITLFIFTIILCFFSYLRDKELSSPHLISFKNPFHPQLWVLSLIPFLAIFGTYIMNFYGKNILLIILIIIIGFIPVLVAFNKIPKKFYYFTVFIISISILYHASLISTHVWGHDIQFEYQFANLVINNSYWDFKLNESYNSVLSVVILAPIISKVSGMDLTWIFKVIYPFIFSLMPLGLYGVFKKQTTDKIAFFSCFLIISFSGFSYGWMVWVARQQIAELFFVLLIMLIWSDMKNIERNLLLIIFGISLVVSHYTLSFLLIAALFGALIILFLADTNRIKKLVEKLNLITDRKIKSHTNSIQVKETRIIKYLLVFLIVATLLWYGWVGSNIFKVIFLNLNLFYTSLEKFTFLLGTPTALIYILENYFLWILILIILAVSILQIIRFSKIKKEHHPHYLNIFKDLPIKNRDLTGKMSFKLLILIVLSILILYGLWISKLKMMVVNEYLAWTVIIFMLIGFALSIMKVINNKFKREYYAISFIILVILLLILSIPPLNSLFQIYRIFEISLILLAPFGIIGGIKIFEIIIKVYNMELDKSGEISLKLISIFLMIFLLFNSGFTDAIIYGAGPIQFNNHSDTPKFTDAEYLSADWLIQSKIPKIKIYADNLGFLLLEGLKGANTNYIKSEDLSLGSYIYLRKYNLENDKFVIVKNEKVTNIKLKARLESGSNEIYDNGLSQIMRVVKK
jgi:uncharacterized membrane protein